MTQKSSVVQILNSVPQVLTSDRPEKASAMVGHMVHTENRWSGDQEYARKRLENKYGLKLWSYLYRPPKTICTKVYARIRAAYLDHCEKIAKRELERIEIEKLKGTEDDYLEDLCARSP